MTMSDDGYGSGPIAARGCVTSLMVVRAGGPPEAVPAMIERDRLHMAARPGLYLKLLPVLPEPAKHQVLTGGAYLFDTVEHAAAFDHWAAHEFAIDGVPFVRQPLLESRVAKVWEVIGAENFRPVAGHQVLMRMEEWRRPPGLDRATLARDWPGLRDDARAAGLSAAWLLWSDERGEIGLVTAGDRAGTPDPAAPDLASLQALARARSPGSVYEKTGAERLLDRASFVFSVWFPITGGPSDRPPLWPNSPPLPGPAA